MRVGVLGSGLMGGTLGTIFARAGGGVAWQGHRDLLAAHERVQH
jgi:prephenate dehydrogenase